jgi:hypothetical protein
VAVAAIVVASVGAGPVVAGAAGWHGPRHRWHGHHGPWLTAEQRVCLKGQDLPAQLRAAPGPRARVAVVRAAFAACGVTFPHGGSTGSTTTTTTTTKPPPIEPN